MRALTTLLLFTTACGAPGARPEDTARPAPPARAHLESAPIDEREAAPTLGGLGELALSGWIFPEEGVPLDRIVWDEDARGALELDGEPWGAADQFEVHATLSLAGSASPARLTIEVTACVVPPPRGPSAGATQAFGTTLEWLDVSEAASAPEGCAVVAQGIDAHAWLHDTPVQCPPTAHAYFAMHCSHRTCVRFGLFDDVPPEESALARAAGRGRFAWVSPVGPAGACD